MTLDYKWQREWRAGLQDAEAFLEGRDRTKDAAAVEATLLESWQDACVLRLDLPNEERESMMRCLVGLRYHLSLQTAPVTFTGQDLRGWVRILRKFAKQFQHSLGRLEDYGEPPEEAVLLATIVATAIRVVKNFFWHKSETVPWTEVEFLLVAFVRSSTRYWTETFVVATPQKLVKHLAVFDQELEQVEKDCCQGIDKLANLSRNFLQSRSRDAFLSKLMQGSGADAPVKALQALHRDFTVLRDLESLRSIIKALDVALQALKDKDDDQDWERRGRWAVRRALFVVGENMKGSWMCPNLSGRSAGFIKALVHEDILNSLTNIRDDLGHPKSKIIVPQSLRRLEDNLMKVKRAVDVQLIAVEIEFKEDYWDRVLLDHPSLSRDPRIIFPESEIERKSAIPKEVLSNLKDIFKEAGAHDCFESVMEKCGDLTVQCLRGTDGSPRRFVGRLGNPFTPRGLEKEVLLQLTNAKAPLEYKLRARRLIHSYLKATCDLERAAEELSTASDKPLSNLVDVRQCVRDLQAILDKSQERADDRDRFAVNDILMTLAPTWFCDHWTPVASTFSPVLFGHHLRNYLHHEDAFIQECLSPQDEVLSRSCLQLITQLEDLSAVWVMRPRWTGYRNAEHSYVRLLELAREKDAVFQAVKRGAAVRQAARRVFVGARDPQGRHLAHTAAAAGQLHVLRWVLQEESCQMDTKDWTKRTPLHDAASKDVADFLLEIHRQQAVRRLSRRQLRQSNAQMASAYTIHALTAFHNILVVGLHRAAMDGRLDLTRVLLDAGVAINAPFLGCTALSRAARWGHDAVVELLLARGASPNFAIVAAARSGSQGCLRLLLERRPSDEQCRLALEEATVAGLEAIFRSLFEELRSRPGFQALRDCSHMLLHRAAGCGSVGILELLLEEWPGAVHDKEDKTGVTALYVAASMGRDDAARCLLKRGARRLAYANDGICTPLSAATFSGYASTLAVLLEDWDHEEPLTDAVLGSLLCDAAQYGHEAVAELLLDRVSDVDAPNSLGNSALIVAASYGHPTMVELLLKRGAQRNQRGRDEVTPLHVAANADCNAGVATVRAVVHGLDNYEEKLDLLANEDKDGLSVLNYALRSGSLSTIKCLLHFELEALYERRKASKKQRGRGKVNVKTYMPLAFRTGHAAALDQAVFSICSRDIFSRLLECLEDKSKLLRPEAGFDYKAVLCLVLYALGTAVCLRRNEEAEWLREWLTDWLRDTGFKEIPTRHTDEDDLLCGILEEEINEREKLVEFRIGWGNPQDTYSALSYCIENFPGNAEIFPFFVLNSAIAYVGKHQEATELALSASYDRHIEFI